MVEQKPAEIKDDDWRQTPPAVRTLLTRSVKRVEQIEARIRDIREQLEQNSTNSRGEQVTLEKPAFQGGTLLVVDDNEMNRDMLSRRLERQGHTVEVAVNGRQALEMIKTQKFDLVLLDIMMPEMNGYQVLEQINVDSDLRHIPVIMITAIDEIDSVVKCIQLGAEDYLPKPFNPFLLKARVGASLEKKFLRDQQEAYMLQLDIENKRKSDELEQARQIQLSMLPASPPILPHLNIAARQVTASEVGGDYYDFFSQANGSLFMAIGDATGHGVGSGLMVSMTKASLLATNETHLITLVEKINAILTKIDLGAQLNMALLLLEISEMQEDHVTVRVTGGGNPPIYILRATGMIEEVLISALPLGITDEARYDLTEFTLTSGDAMLLMSDGLPEMFNPQHEILGYDRLVSALQQINIANLTAAEILDQIANIGKAWAAGHAQYDDMTLVVTKVK